MREDNLPPLDGQRTFITVHSISEYDNHDGILPYADCKEDRESNPQKQFAHAALLKIGDPMLFDWTYSSIVYEPCDDCSTVNTFYSAKDITYFQCYTSNTDILSIVRGATTHNPSYVQDALNFLNRTDVICEREGLGSRKYTPVMPLSYKPYTQQSYRSELLRADFTQVEVELKDQSKHILDAIYADEVPYVYIVMLHDCNKVCIKSAIGDYDFIAGYKIMRDILFCSSAIVHGNAQPQENIPALKLIVLPTDLPSVKTYVYSMDDIQHDLNTTKPSVCSQRTFSEYNCEYVGNAFSILHHRNEGLIAQVKHYNYSIKCDDDDDFVAFDTQTAQRNVFDDDLPYSVVAALHFVHDTDNLRMMIDALSEQDALYNYSGAWPAQQLLQEHDIAAQMRNNTYVNIVHNCKVICLQTVLSNSSEFMQAYDVQTHGLLCLNEIWNWEERNYQTTTALAAQNTTTGTIKTTLDTANTTLAGTRKPVCDISCCESIQAKYNASAAQPKNSTVVTSMVLGSCLIFGSAAAIFAYCKASNFVRNICNRFNFRESLRNHHNDEGGTEHIDDENIIEHMPLRSERAENTQERREIDV